MSYRGDGKKAMETRKWVDLNPDRLKYQMIFVKGDAVGSDDTLLAKEFLDESR